MKQKLKTLILVGFTLSASMANAKVRWGNWCFEPTVGTFAEGPFAISFYDELVQKKIVFLKNGATGRNSMPGSCYNAAYQAATEELRLCVKFVGSLEETFKTGPQVTVNNVKNCTVQ